MLILLVVNDPIHKVNSCRMVARQPPTTFGRNGTMRESAWKHSFITGMTPEQAAQLAGTYTRNNAAADRKRKR
jgi:hypothetical protein